MALEVWGGGLPAFLTLGDDGVGQQQHPGGGWLAGPVEGDAPRQLKAG